ncbi:MAG: T9SS type A sorting domain-containing protein [Ignavibacteriales bacterium]|nr:T9SS type A sorting domain-containing protein [Ignavibacteriales bacterium]
MRRTYNYIFRLVLIFLLTTAIQNKILSQSTLPTISLDINKIHWGNYTPQIPDGLATITFTPGTQAKYLSIGATNNATSQFNIIVSNMYLPSSSETPGPLIFSTTFDFSLISAPPYSVPLSLTVYIHLLDAVGFYPFDPSTFVDQKIITVNTVENNAIGAGDGTDPGITITPLVRPGQSVGDPMTNYQYRPDAPNLDLDNTQNGISATYAGDLNACVPTATANSMKWLQSKYTDVSLPADMNLKKTEQTLSGKMKRKNGQGTPINNFISGKLDFIEQYNLPLEVKFQSSWNNNPVGVVSTSGKSIGRNFDDRNNPNPKPTWDYLLKNMKNGEDVEMNYFWKDPTDQKWYGHSVNVTGLNEFQDGTKKIAFKHDGNQSATGGLREDIEQVTVDANGWMRFGQNNQNFITDVVAESPVVQEGRDAAAFFNEFFTDAAPRKVTGNLATPQFVEVALKSTITDINNYTVTMYDGKTGASYATYTLDQFTVGTTSNGLTTYYKTFPSNNLLGPPAGVAISRTGAVIQNQFISYGGSFTAVDGDATGLTSNDIGMIPTTASVQLSGSGTAFSQFSFNYGVPTPGNINQNESYSSTNLSKPGAVSPNNGDKNKSGAVTITWTKVTSALNYQLQISADPFFLTNILIDNSSLTDSTYSFANANLEGSKIYWRVRALGTNLTSGYSPIRSYSNKLNTPTNLNATSSSSKNNLTWTDNSTSETGYSIERKDGNASSANNYSVVQTVTANSNSYTDQNVTAGSTYTYRIRAVNNNAESDYSSTSTVSTVTAIEKDQRIPTEFSLDQNYPNPFNPTTIISYSIPENSFVQLKVYDLLGNVITTLVSENQGTGIYKITFDGSNLTSGIYFYQLITPKYSSTKKLMLIK